jgi:hypothetical protein
VPQLPLLAEAESYAYYAGAAPLGVLRRPGGYGAAPAQQPLGDRRVQAAGHRVLEHRSAVVTQQRADLEGTPGAGRVRAHHSDVE